MNWRSGPYEIDIIARKGDVLHIVEVKTRREASLTPPSAAATRRKFHALRHAAAHYLALTHWAGEVQFDLASVIRDHDGRCRVELVEQAMESHW